MAEGESLRQICQDEHLPSRRTVLRWADANEEFCHQYTRAREFLVEYWADEIIAIADDGTNDYIERESKDGSKTVVVDHEHINRSRLRVDARKWLMSKILPKRYGNKIEHTGADGDGLIVEIIDPIRTARSESDAEKTKRDPGYFRNRDTNQDKYKRQ